jgi:uncharacterized damage-inducible protein DinB
MTPLNLRDTILNAWKTNNRVTVFLFENLPVELWEAQVPGGPRRTIRMLAAHIHNCRCSWVKTLGKEHGIAVPKRIDRLKVKPKELISAMQRSSTGILNLLKFGCEKGGSIPAPSSYVWRNLPLDVGHIQGYFIAHEGHHRGQIIMLARQLGYRLRPEVAGGIWHWTKRSRET